MTESRRTSSERAHLEQLIFDYLDSEARGRAPDPEELLSAHPEYAEELEVFLAAHRRVREIAAPLVSVDDAPARARGRRGDLDGNPPSDLTGTIDAHASDDLDDETGPDELGMSVDLPERYAIENEIARGGMGVVFRARDCELSRLLAIKAMLYPGTGDSSSSDDSRIRLARFLEEAQITARLDHPGVVPVHDLGVDARGRAYFSMKLVRGRELGEVFDLARREVEGWNLSRAIGVMIKACQALAFAHSRGVVHRDVKPSNIMVGRYGEVYVMDWGLAKLANRKDLHDTRIAPDSTAADPCPRAEDDENFDGVTETPLFTMDGCVVGTPSYMPPEQARGQIDEIDASSDVYSVGAILYNLLTGRAPYVEPDSRISPRMALTRLLEGPPSPILEVDPDAPAELVAVCEKAMARRKEDRYASSLELAEDLQAWVDGRVVQAYETGAVAQLRKWIRRNRALAMSAVVSVVVAILGLFAVVVVQRGANRELEEKNTEISAAAETARRSLYGARMLVAKQDWDTKRIRWLQDSLEEHVPAEINAPDFRGWEWYYLRSLCHGEKASLIGHLGAIHSVAWSPSGDAIASAGEDSLVRIWSHPGGDLLFALRGHQLDVRSVSWSRDGGRLASGGDDRTVRIWDAIDGTRLLTLRAHEGSVTSTTWSPDSEHLASAGIDGTVVVWNSRTGERLRTLGASPEAILSLRWSPDGQWLVSGHEEGPTGDGPITMWSTEDWRGHPILERVGLRSVRAVAWSADSTSFASATEHGPIKVWDLPVPTRRPLLRAHNEFVRALAWSPVERRLASAGDDATVKLWDVDSSKVLVSLSGHSRTVNSLDFHPFGDLLVSGGEDGAIRTWDASGRANQDEMPFTRHYENWVSSVEWSPDGDRLAIAYFLGDAEIWDPSSDRIISLSEHSGRVWYASWSPSGDRLATAGSDRTIRIWDAEGGPSIDRFDGHLGTIEHLDWSADGKMLASTSKDAAVIVWDVARGSRVSTLYGDQRSIAWSPRGALLPTKSRDGAIEIRDIPRGEIRVRLRGHRGFLHSVAWSPDGDLLAAGDDEGRIQVWSPSEGELVQSWRGHGRIVASLAWSPDGDRIASGAFDGALKIFDPIGGQEVLTLRIQPAQVFTVAWSPDGRRLASGSFDNKLRIWDASRGYDLSTDSEFRRQRALRRLETGSELRATGRLLAAMSELRQAREVLERLIAGSDDVERGAFSDDLARVLIEEGLVHDERGESKLAEQQFARARSIWSHLEETSPGLISRRLADFHEARGEDDKARSSRVAIEDIKAGVEWPRSRTRALIPFGSVWRFHDRGTNDLGTRWREVDFDDSAWPEGPAPLGYGDEELGTEVAFGDDRRGKHITTYFRRTVSLPDVDHFVSLKLRLRRDDGAAVFVNGREVVRDNLAPGALADEPALSPSDGADELRYQIFVVPADVLRPGRNTVAVEVHQVNPTSSDIVFDLLAEVLVAEEYDSEKQRP